MSRIYFYLYALLLSAFLAPTFTNLYAPLLMARYYLLALVAPITFLALLANRPRLPRTAVALAFLLLLYALASALWSDDWRLTIAKLLFYAATAATFVLGPALIAEWGGNPFRCFAPVVVFTIVLSVLALVTGDGWREGNFTGYAWNSNALGAIFSFASPWLIFSLWFAWRDRTVGGRRKLYLYVSLCGLALLFVAMSRSRSVMLMLLVLVAVLFAQSHPKRKAAVVFSLCFSMLLAYLLKPSLFGGFAATYVKKSSTSAFASRQDQFQDSWVAAKNAGLLGLGFGVSAGAPKWNFGTFASVSREKGNSQLAVVEELGLPGFLLYLALLVALGHSILKWGYTGPEGPIRRMFRFLVFGYFLGAVVNSGFEAWFMAPAPETAAFWAVLGIGFVLLYRPAQSPVPQFVAVPYAPHPQRARG